MPVSYGSVNNFGPAFLTGQALTAQPDSTAVTNARTEPESLTKGTATPNTGRSHTATETVYRNNHQ